VVASRSEDTKALEPALEVPLHHSLTQPILVAGLPRTLGLLLWTGTSAFALGLHQLWVVPIAVALHGVFGTMARRDPYFFDVIVRAVGQRRLDP
jgi:type IV secretion system protein VirB3